MPRELPIFPLQLVLFPGALQPLHIFEPRYRQLLADSLAGDRRFGIAYAAETPARDPTPQPGDVGCVAEIRSTQDLPDGRRDFARLLAALAVLTDRPEESPTLPDDAELLSFEVAARLEFEPQAKLELLRVRNTLARLRHLAALLGPLAADAERRATMRRHAHGNGKSGMRADIERTAP